MMGYGGFDYYFFLKIYNSIVHQVFFFISMVLGVTDCLTKGFSGINWIKVELLVCSDF